MNVLRTGMNMSISRISIWLWYSWLFCFMAFQTFSGHLTTNEISNNSV